MNLFARALADGRLFWRCADQYGRSCNGGDRTFRLEPGTVKKPGPWAPRIDDVLLCSRGYHATSDPLRWSGLTVELVEVDAVAERLDNKIVCHTMRSLGRVDPMQCADARIFVAASRPDLNGASLDGASLDGASLNRASLNRASLYRASLDGASLDGASLDRASLNGARHADDATWTGARYSRYTSWPPGFDPKAHGATEVEP